MFQLPEMAESFLRVFHSLSRSLHPIENFWPNRIVTLESRFLDYIRCGISVTTIVVDLKKNGCCWMFASGNALD